MNFQSITRWSGLMALVASGVAMWRAESHAAGHEIASQRTTAPIAPAAPASVEHPVAPTVLTPVHEPSAPVAPVSARAHEARAAHAQLNPEGQLTVRHLIIARDVQDRTPVEAGESFEMSRTDRLYAYLDMANDTGETLPVEVTFERDGRTAAVGMIELQIPSQPRWRTWGFSRMIHTAGSWTAIVRDHTGHELARTQFEVITAGQTHVGSIVPPVT